MKWSELKKILLSFNQRHHSHVLKNQKLLGKLIFILLNQHSNNFKWKSDSYHRHFQRLQKTVNFKSLHFISSKNWSINKICLYNQSYVTNEPKVNPKMTKFNNSKVTLKKNSLSLVENIFVLKKIIIWEGSNQNSKLNCQNTL